MDTTNINEVRIRYWYFMFLSITNVKISNKDFNWEKSILYVYLIIMQSECAVFEDMEHLHFDMTNMSRYIKPRINRTYSVNIDIVISFGAIQDFDEISGEPPTMGKQLVNFITCGCESSAPFL
jgi:hypothetical protein